MKHVMMKVLYVIILLAFGGAAAEVADHIGLPLWRKHQDDKHADERALKEYKMKLLCG